MQVLHPMMGVQPVKSWCYSEHQWAWKTLATEAGEYVPEPPQLGTLLPDVWIPMFAAIARENGAGEWGASLVAEKVMTQYAHEPITPDSCAAVIATIKALVRA